MIIATAFSNKDSHTAAALFGWIAQLSGRIDAQCVLVHEPSVDPSPVAREAVKAFSRVTHHQIQPALVPALDRWPHAPNIYFASTAEAMSRQGEPWYFFEPDNLPSDPMWYYKLQRAYFASGKRCMGAFFPSWFEQNGKWIPAGKHLTGTAIYPADLYKRSTLMQFLVRMTHDSVRMGVTPQAFDVYLAGELVQNSQETHLIQHTWRSHNFRLVDRVITFDVIDPDQKGLAQTLRIRTTIDPESVNIHGCKDGSLLRLFQKLHQSGELREALLRAPALPQNAPEAAGGTLSAPTKQNDSTVILEPFVPVRAKKEPKPEGSEWGDSIPNDAFRDPETPPQPACAPMLPNPEQPKIAQRIPAQAPAELLEAKRRFKATEHYAGCMSKTPILHHNGSHCELRCECGMRLPLAPGVDWQTVWKGERESESVVVQPVEESPKKGGDVLSAPNSTNGLSSNESTPHTTETATAPTVSASNAAPESDPPVAAPKGFLSHDARLRYIELQNMCKGSGGFVNVKAIAKEKGVVVGYRTKKEELLRLMLFKEFGDGMVEKFETV